MIVELNEKDIAVLRQIVESVNRGEYIKGESGGESFLELSNDYSRTEALKYFLCGITNRIKLNSTDEEVKEFANSSLLPRARMKQFEKTYEKFEQFKEQGSIKLWRGLVLTDGAEVDLGKSGECWSFSRAVPRRWVDEIVDRAAMKHILHEDTRKYILTGRVDVDNCRLPYSFWLAGRFERPEWEVRVKDEDLIKIIKKDEVE